MDDHAKKKGQDMKRRTPHEGPCSSPRNQPGDTACTCPAPCPLHGRCCDCIAHHKEKRLNTPDPVAGDYSWLPHCLREFDKLNGLSAH